MASIKQLQIPAPIGVAAEDPLAQIAASDHVIERAGKVDSRFSGHGSRTFTAARAKAGIK
jgi:hypothetical protein